MRINPFILRICIHADILFPISGLFILPQSRDLVKYDLIFDLDVGTLHAGGTGLNDTRALEFAQGVDDH